MSFPGLPASSSSSEPESDATASCSSLISVLEVRGKGHSCDQCPVLPQLKQASALAWLVLGMCWGGADGLGEAEEEDIGKEGEAEIRS